MNVPTKGQKHDTLHLIEEELAMRFLPSARILRMRLALATKPYDVFFLCQVPSQNLDLRLMRLAIGKHSPILNGRRNH